MKGVGNVEAANCQFRKLFDNHQIVPPSSYTTGAVHLPSPEEIPNINMQVINYHRPLLGTFHSKYVVIDRKVALLTSCNIMETDNMEMMCHFEGQIVDSFYDMALISWHKALEPPLPTLHRPAAMREWGWKDRAQPGPCHNSGGEPTGELIETRTSSDTTSPSSPSTPTPPFDKPPEYTVQNTDYDPDIISEVARVQARNSPSEGESRMAVVTKHLSKYP